MRVTLGHLDAIPEGEGRVFEVGARRLAVFRSRDGRVFTTQAECPHRGGPLSDGLIGGSTLVCPLHSWKFDLVTGASLGGECSLVTYPTRLDENGKVVIELND